MKSKFVTLTFIIFIVALFIRIVGMGKVPPHLSNDEISIAYDAYSLLHTGRDEHNHLFPLSFQSHNTYKAPLTAYLLIPTTAIWGPSELASKLPSATLGSLTVLMLIIMTWQIFRLKSLALFSGTVLAITPWHIYTSHMILESNIALFFVITGISLFFKYQENRKLNVLIFSMIFFSLSVYSYHTEWLFTPLLLAGMGLIFRINLKLKDIITGGLVFGICILPLVIDTYRQIGQSTRGNTEAIIYEPTLQETLNNPRLSLTSKTRTLVNAVISNYANYFNFGYLFSYGLDIPPKPLTTQSGLFLGIFLPYF